MLQVNESEKLMVNEFVPSLENVPLQVLYINQKSASYSSSGFNFDIRAPSMNALLDPDIWIHYQIRYSDYSIKYDIAGNYVGSPGTLSSVMSDTIPERESNLWGLRQGNVIQHAIQNLTVTINGHTLNNQPWKFIDVMDKIYVSDIQSKHEFSASGGKFDNGTVNSITRDYVQTSLTTQALTINNGDEVTVEITPGLAYSLDSTIGNIYVYGKLPTDTHYYNEGFTDRVHKMLNIIRNKAKPNCDITERFNGDGAISGTNNLNGYLLDIYERVPISPFKMYTKDEVVGVIPNIRQIQMTGSFCTNMLNCMTQASFDNDSSDNPDTRYMKLDWTGINTSHCEMFLTWYTPPDNISIPREITIPYKRIHCWDREITFTSSIPSVDNSYADQSVSEYNITMDAVPDLLIIFIRRRKYDCTTIEPTDMHCELRDLYINLEGASGKLNSINTIQLYQKWRKYLKHSDSEVIEYDRWRKYHCVALLKPEDYGVIAGPGYDNPITFGVVCTARNWQTWPGLAREAGLEDNDAYCNNSINYELIVMQVFEKWALTLNNSGSAKCEMLRYVANGRKQATPVPPGIGNISV